MSSWIDVEPGTDVRGQTVRVIRENGTVAVQGLAMAEGLRELPPHILVRVGPGWLELRVIPDPDAEGLDEESRERASQALAHSAEHVAHGHQTRGVGVGVRPEWTLQQRVDA